MFLCYFMLFFMLGSANWIEFYYVGIFLFYDFNTFYQSNIPSRKHTFSLPSPPLLTYICMATEILRIFLCSLRISKDNWTELKSLYYNNLINLWVESMFMWGGGWSDVGGCFSCWLFINVSSTLYCNYFHLCGLF